MTVSSTEFSCSTMEAVYAAALLGAKHLVGFPDPCFGWLTDEVDRALTSARERLVERRVLELHPDGSATLHDPASALLAGCISARASLLVTCASPDEVRQINYHLTADGTVVHVPAPDHSAHTLWLSQEPESLVEQVLAFFPLEGQVAPVVRSGGICPDDALRQARTKAAESGAAAAAALLEQAGLPPEVAAALARSLAEPAWNGLLVGIVRADPEWRVAGVAFLAGAGGLWRLQTITLDGVTCAEVSPCTAEQAAAELRSVLLRAIAG